MMIRRIVSFGVVAFAVISILMVPSLVQASNGSMGGSMESMISHLGNVTHFNSAGSYQDQSTGHYSAGGMMIRQRNRTHNLINIQPPSFGGSCGDFDLRFGGISFIKLQELVKTMKAAAQGVPAYAFQLALKTTCPVCANTMAALQKKLEEINGLLLNECSMRQQMLEGILPTGSAMHEKVCDDINRGSDEGLDFYGSRERCQSKPDRHKAVHEAKKKYPDLVIGNFNLVWMVLKKMPRYANDREASERIMSLVGTVVSQKNESDEEKDFNITFIDPKSDETKFVEAHLQGGHTEIYHCSDGDECLQVSTNKLVIPYEQSLSRTVYKHIESMKQKYLNESAFSPAEMTFLSDSVNLPVYKYIQISASTGIAWPMEKVSQYFALSILLKQFEEVASEILKALSILEAIQNDTKLIQEFKKRLEQARSRLQSQMSALDSKEVFMIDKLIRTKEKELRANYDYERRY